MPEVVVGRDDEDLKKYGIEGTILIGKHIVGSGEEAHTTTPILMDVLRPHIIMLSGKRGYGKCLLPETSILLSDGTTMRIDDIFNLAKSEDDNQDEEYLKFDDSMTILSVNKNLNIIPKMISHVYRKKVKETLIKIKTKTGRGIVATKEHPLLVAKSMSSGQLLYLQWLVAENLSISDNIASYNNGNVFWDKIIEKEEIIYDGYVYDLTIPETHNFIAGSNGGIVCHNSYSMGVFVEELKELPESIKKNLCALVVDTQGIFWTMKSPSEKDAQHLAEWDMKPMGFDVYVYVPEGQVDIFRKGNVDFDDAFSFMPSELTVEDWMNVFGIDPNQPLGILLQRTINKLKKISREYSINDIIATIKAQIGFETEKINLENRFLAANDWGIFGESNAPNVLEPGKVSILDVSITPQNVRALLVALILRRVFVERVTSRRKEELAEIEMTRTKRTPMPWIFIDEAHNFLPNEGTTPATDVLLKITKEGRQPGLTLVLATQRPEKLHSDALAQCDMIISHRLTAKADIDALKAIMQTYMLFDIGKYINELPKLKGTAIILDDNSERLYKVYIRPRQSWHAGASPVAW